MLGVTVFSGYSAVSAALIAEQFPTGSAFETPTVPRSHDATFPTAVRDVRALRGSVWPVWLPGVAGVSPSPGPVVR
jgi:hypothetical protein